MMRATGIHFSGRSVRVATLETGHSGYRLIAVAEARIPVPFGAASLEDPGVRRRFGDVLRETFSGIEGDLGAVVASLGGGLYHIRKVLLEVASQDDRREQIAWEVAQALISPAEEYLVRYYAAKRAAVWVAVRRQSVELVADLFTGSGVSPDAFGVEPMAMARACELSGVWGSGRCAAVWIDPPWVSLATGEDGLLVAAETVHVGQSEPGGAGSDYGVGAGDRRDLRELVESWVHGNGALDQRRAAHDRVFICGSDKDQVQMMQGIQSSGGPKLSHLRPFSSCDTRILPEAQHQLLRRQDAFCIAAGLASLGLGRSALEPDPSAVSQSLPETDAGLTLLP